MHSPGGARLGAAAALLAVTAPSLTCSLVPLDGLSGREAFDASAAGDAEAGIAATGYAAQVLADAPLAYWRLGELGGTIAKDASGHGHDATYVGGVAYGATGALAGDSDTAVTLDGLTGFVTAGKGFAFGGQSPFAIEAWVRASSVTTYAGVASCNDAVGGPPSEGYLVFVGPSDGAFGFQRLDGASQSSVSTTATASATSFTYVVATFDGLAITLYSDGEAQGAQTASFAIAGAGADFVLGAEVGGGGNYLAGTLDEVAVYDHVLAADRIRAHFLAGHAGP